MDSMTIIAVASIVTAGLTTGFGCLGPALGEGKGCSLIGSPLLHRRLTF